MTIRHYLGSLDLARLLLLRGLAAIYFVAFLSAWNQFPALLGERGLLPVRRFLERVRFRDMPSLFHWHYSDRLLRIVAAAGMLGSIAALIGVTERVPLPVSISVWLVMWALYLSIVNVGQTFYSFGWESMLCEAGFFAAFLGTASIDPPWIVILILRWMLFRVEFGAGLIKLRHDECWRNLTCLYYHYETQPLPNPLSWYFHRLPKWMHRQSVLFSHFVQVAVPFGIFAPQPIASAAAAVLIFHQLLLIISGNYSWLNWLTVVLGAAGFSDELFRFATPETTPAPLWFTIVVYAVAAMTLAMSIRPALNFFSRNQMMNFCWNRWHLVCAYGAFGSITKERYEIILEGTTADAITPDTEWIAYEFRAKPVDVARIPPQVAPYHLRLDWLMWFLPFSVTVTPRGIYNQGYEIWFIRFVQRLFEGDRQTVALLRRNPFPDRTPTFIRARYFLYQYADRKGTRDWWKRTYIDDYLPPISLRSITAAVGERSPSHR